MVGPVGGFGSSGSSGPVGSSGHVGSSGVVGSSGSSGGVLGFSGSSGVEGGVSPSSQVQGEIGLEHAIQQFLIFYRKSHRLPTSSDKGMSGIYRAVRRGEYNPYGNTWRELKENVSELMNNEESNRIHEAKGT